MEFCEEKLKENFSRNLTAFRKMKGLTQLDLAEKLNYSDKLISKWERGEGLPDFQTVVRLSKIFEVSVDALVAEKEPKRVPITRNKLIITLLSIGLVWLVAAISHFVLKLIFTGTYDTFKMEYVYLYAVPVSAIVGVVFTKLWWNRVWQFIASSSLVWTLCVCCQVSIHLVNMWLIYIVAAVLQVLIILWFLIKK